MKKLFFFLLLLALAVGASAQQSIQYDPFRLWGRVAIGGGNDSLPDANSVLEIGRYGLKRAVYFNPFNRLQTLSPKLGFFGVDLADSSCWYHDGIAWRRLL